MATYPTGVFSPTSKNAGDTIQPSHINDVQSEITAVEDALKNGIQHALTINGALTVSTGGLTVSTGSVNIGGPSSLASLSVSGGSTLATLAVTSTASFASSVTVASMTVTGALTVGTLTQTIPSVQLSLASNLALSSVAEVSPNWTVQDWSVGGMHSTSANSSRITFAHSTGIYVVGFTGAFNNTFSQTGAIRYARIRYNDTSAVCGGTLSQVGGTSTETRLGLSISGMVRAASTSDYVTVRVRHTNDNLDNITLHADSTQFTTTFWAHKVSG